MHPSDTPGKPAIHSPLQRERFVLHCGLVFVQAVGVGGWNDCSTVVVVSCFAPCDCVAPLLVAMLLPD